MIRLTTIYTYPVKSGHRVDHDHAEVYPWGLAGDRRWMIVDQDQVGVTQRQLVGLVALRPRIRPGGLVLHAAGRPSLDVPEPVDGDRLAVRVFANRTPTPAYAAGPAADAWLSDLCGRPVRLVWSADRPADPQRQPGDRVNFVDSRPVLLTSTASLDALNALIEADGTEGPLPMTRFRPNLVISGATQWAEDDWLGHRLRIGAITFQAVKSCSRCMITTVDQETGRVGREPLDALVRHRRVGQKIPFGIYLAPVVDGTPAADAPIGTVTVGDPVELLD